MFLHLNGMARLGGYIMIWRAKICSIRQSQNDVVFSGSWVTLKDMEDMIILLNWKCYLGRHVGNSCTFSELTDNPIIFMCY